MLYDLRHLFELKQVFTDLLNLFFKCSNSSIHVSLNVQTQSVKL